MPLGLKYIADEQVFAAVAEVPESIGFVCGASWAQRTWTGGAIALLDHLRRDLLESTPDEHAHLEAGPGAPLSTICVSSVSQLRATLPHAYWPTAVSRMRFFAFPFCYLFSALRF
jgi:hypothetical protein